MADPQVNFFKSTLVGTYSDTDTSITIATGDGALLPDPSVDGAFNLTIFEGLQVTGSTEFEIVRVTARSGDVLTVTRGAESTTPLTIGSATHSILMSATKKTFDDINTAIANVDLTNLTGVEELTFDSTGDEEFGLPAGTTAQRPSNPSAGYMRYNTETAKLEVYSGGVWGLVSLENVRVMQTAQLSVTANDAVAENVLNYTSATGGTTLEYDSGGKRYRSHTFTSDDDFVVTSVGDTDGDRDKVDYLIIAGGGSGVIDRSSGGGGAGGYRTTNGTSGGNSTAESKISITQTTYPVVIGAGGAETSVASDGNNGSNSSALGITATGGGFGGPGFENGTNSGNGASGGSGGGAGGAVASSKTGGSATSSQGSDGGDHTSADNQSGGAGGGGAGAVGASVNNNRDGANGGDGLSNILRTGSAETRAGGGGGSARSDNTGDDGGTGGSGGGGNGGGDNVSTAGAVNTGSGGGAQEPNTGGASSGGSGIVILRYEIEPTA